MKNLLRNSDIQELLELDNSVSIHHNSFRDRII